MSPLVGIFLGVSIVLLICCYVYLLLWANEISEDLLELKEAVIKAQGK